MSSHSTDIAQKSKFFLPVLTTSWGEIIHFSLAFLAVFKTPKNQGSNNPSYHLIDTQFAEHCVKSGVSFQS